MICSSQAGDRRSFFPAYIGTLVSKDTGPQVKSLPPRRYSTHSSPPPNAKPSHSNNNNKAPQLNFHPITPLPPYLIPPPKTFIHAPQY